MLRPYGTEELHGSLFYRCLVPTGHENCMKLHLRLRNVIQKLLDHHGAGLIYGYFCSQTGTLDNFVV